MEAKVPAVECEQIAPIQRGKLHLDEIPELFFSHGSLGGGDGVDQFCF